MQLHYWWWLAALALGIVEMLTGTFYLLVLAVGCAAAGAAGQAGLGLTAQLIIAAAVTLIGWVVLYRWRPLRRHSPVDTHADPDVLLDVGERVQVAAWVATGRADVVYRGARWDAELAAEHRGGRPPAAGIYRIRGIIGNRLQLAPMAETENAS
ncbi:MAG TPA: NfeD family protein [Burkholderiaceae bacterium]|nr:NfeD family protein [Burkholderiaceae bacterium]